MRTIYVTKYALTQGILEMQAEERNSQYPDMAVVPEQEEPVRTYRQYFHNPDWYETREAAVRRANKMVETKLASLAKSAAKMKKLNFE